MPIQVDQPKRSLSVPAAAVLGTLLLIGIIIATNWRALILVLILLAAGAGWWLAH